MKPGAIKLVLTVLVLCGAAIAADRSTGTFLQNATTGAYRVSASGNYLELELTTYRFPNGDQGAYLYVYAFEWSDWKYLNASGAIPTSMLKASGNTISVNISDLRELPSGFNIDEFNWSGPIAVNCTITATSLSKEDIVDKYTQRTPQPDGTVAVNTSTNRYIRTSAYAEGTVAGYSLPISGNYWEDVYLQQGNYKSHFVP
jgi:hypothetical protein